MGDHEARAPRAQRGHRRLDEHLRAGVDRARRFVEDEDRRVGEERPGDGEELLLPRAHRATFIVDDGVVAVRQGVHEAVDVRGSGGSEDLVLGGRRVAVGDVLPDRAAEQPRVLQHHADVRPQLAARHRRDVAVVECDAAAVELVEPHDEVDERGLAGARRADDRHRRPRFSDEREIVDQRLGRVVGEPHMLELDAAARLAGRRDPVDIGDLLLGVEQLEHPLGRRDARLQHVHHRRRLGERLRELAGVLDERLHVTEAHRPRRHP